ncbi:putative protein translocation complex, SEC61 gamma subunit [Gregarina niphandrodes]|uniref:Uncharacterized protein n=1 Tax=Gregarina niphandrodes TaxID=110365 RepID=A0A023B0T6_GRENI|nr:putative protein translocation complex, SEC61 gamma subunit [Gregarina niphandrodes]EZG44860.1 putative protein translocation complex, SEC61 gamma subunit [Gregarina niphandrodes]|eukprot:XP_011132628.1 putative protein translocation complex, SEC61 gamma subunit [Gregarina niphandrodes]
MKSGMLSDPTHPVGYLNKVIEDFAQDGIRLLRKCNKPDAKEYHAMLRACTLGLLTMGFIGYFVRLAFIPINNIIVGSARK